MQQKSIAGPELSFDCAVLFARRDSVYKSLVADVYDEDRDALNYNGSLPVIAHPPCRAWGQLRMLANPRPGEKELAIWAVAQVRKWGGVLEHPRKSTLWPHCNLPAPGSTDEFGGWTLVISQRWWGHKAEKLTNLYIVGCSPKNIPLMPMKLGAAEYVCGAYGRRKDGSRLLKGMPGWKPEITPAEREHTPHDLAVWLIELAKKCRVNQCHH